MICQFKLPVTSKIEATYQGNEMDGEFRRAPTVAVADNEVSASLQ